MNKPMYYHRIRKNRAGKWFWTLFARNGRKVATSGEGYAKRVHAESMVMKLFGAVLAIVIMAACGVTPPPVVTPGHTPGVPDDASLASAQNDCRALWRDELGREIDEVALADCGLQVSLHQRSIEDYRTQIRESEEYAAYQARLDAERVARRRGLVSLAGRVFIDADGPWLAWGPSWFSALWQYQHDRDRFNADAATVREAGDYVRAFVVVGPSGGWTDRTLTPADVGAVGAATDEIYQQSGHRTQWTIFGGVDSTPTPESRAQLVDAFIDQVAPRQEKLQFVEIANEAWHTGLNSQPWDRDELNALAARVRSRLLVPVATTAPQDVNLEAFYAGSAATIATAHLDRSTDGTGGMFRPIRQARDFAEQRWPWISNEPIGPQSSGSQDDDPARLALSAVYTWLCRGAAYVYHTGAGVRSGGEADRALGRAGSFAEVRNFAPTVALINSARSILPADLPNWQWVNSNDRYPQHPFAMRYTAPDGTKLIAPEEQLLRSFASLAGDGRFVMVPIDVTAPTAFVATRSMTFDVHPITDPRSVIASVSLAPSQSYTLPAMPGAIFIGRFQ